MPLWFMQVVRPTSRNPTDDRDGYRRESKGVHVSPEPEPLPYKIRMTGLSIRESCLDYEASIHVEAIGYQSEETIAYDRDVRRIEGLKEQRLTKGALLVE